MDTNGRREKTRRLTKQISDAGKPLNNLTNRLLGIYERHSLIHRLGTSALPSKRQIIRILSGLDDVLQPGFGSRQNLGLSEVPHFVRDRLSVLSKRIARQFAAALRYRSEPCGPPIPAEARRLTNIFLDRIADLAVQLAEDAQFAHDNDPAASGPEEILICYPGFRALKIHRIAHEIYKLDVPLIPRMMSEYAHDRTGVDIHPGASIGRRMFIDHGTGVVIGQTTVIGNNVKIYQGVTLGNRRFNRDGMGNVVRDGKKRHPTIEDGVVIYANATILGGDTVIGRNSEIGASTWITKSLPPESVVSIRGPKHRYADRSKAPRRSTRTNTPPPIPLAEVGDSASPSITQESLDFLYLARIDRCDDL